MARADKVDPRFRQSRIDVRARHWTRPKIESSDPSFPRDRMLNDEPKEMKDKADNADPTRQNDLSEHALPIIVTARIEAVPPVR
jgi:hypothetical protein